jgi:hypothetical protein
MKIVYIAHPISGDVEANVKKIKDIMSMIYRKYNDVHPVAPYLTCLDILDENNKEERQKGIDLQKQLIIRRCFDEVWVYGSDLSEGVIGEIETALMCDVPVYFKTQLSELVWVQGLIVNRIK